MGKGEDGFPDSDYGSAGLLLLIRQWEILGSNFLTGVSTAYSCGLLGGQRAGYHLTVSQPLLSEVLTYPQNLNRLHCIRAVTIVFQLPAVLKLKCSSIKQQSQNKKLFPTTYVQVPLSVFLTLQQNGPSQLSLLYSWRISVYHHDRILLDFGIVVWIYLSLHL